MQEIVLSLPDFVKGTYVLPVRGVPAEINQFMAAAVEKHAAGALGATTLDLMKTLGTVHSSPVSELPPIPLNTLSVFGASPEQLAKVESATEYIVVSTTFAPGWPPMHEFAGRCAAAAMAAELDTVVIDAFTPQLLSFDRAFATLPTPEKSFRLVEWMMVPLLPESSGYWLTTCGLRRFGHPELQIFDVPQQVMKHWGNIMTGIAFKLFKQFQYSVAGEPGKRPTSFSVREQSEIGAATIALAYGRTAPPDGGGNADIRLALQIRQPTDEITFLTVLPPEGYQKSAAEWMLEVVQSIWGKAEEETRRAPSDDKMGKAIATARDTIPTVRERFNSGNLPSTAQLLVKHKVSDGTNVEYTWSFVSDWSNIDQIQAVCGNDAHYDPAIRVGRPVTITTDSVIDWGIMVDGAMVEGGWTDAVLQGSQ